MTLNIGQISKLKVCFGLGKERDTEKEIEREKKERAEEENKEDELNEKNGGGESVPL